MKTLFSLNLIVWLTITLNCMAQFPWNNPLKIAWSPDGINFNTSTVFQDSAGVPSVIRWKGDTLIAAFQWFRQPLGSPTWDKVAVKFSYDNGSTWTQPSPIIVNGLPQNYQRPFDPSLTIYSGDSIRIFFSSSFGMPIGGLDSSVNTYSAISADGINYFFESGARVDVLNNRVIDPSVIYFNNSWHYLSPIGSPQQGAYHFVSPDAINYMQVPDINSNNFRNWTGNYMISNGNELRFYGCGSSGIWYNASVNGGVWNGYINTNITGGDPSTLQVDANSYLMIYVGQPYNTGLNNLNATEPLIPYPNPSTSFIYFNFQNEHNDMCYKIFNSHGCEVLNGLLKNKSIDVSKLPSANYFIEIWNKENLFQKWVTKFQKK